MAGIQHVLHKACPYSSLRRIIFPRAAYKNSGVPWSGFKPAFRPHSLRSFHGTISLATLKAAPWELWTVPLGTHGGQGSLLQG